MVLVATISFWSRLHSVNLVVYTDKTWMLQRERERGMWNVEPQFWRDILKLHEIADLGSLGFAETLHKETL